MKWSMDRVQRGGPWTGSKGVVRGPGPHGWSMDLGSTFCTHPFESCVSTKTVIVWC